MKHLWLEDELQIRIELNRIIEERVSLVCGWRGVKNLTKLAVKGLVKAEENEIVVLSHPHEPTCSSPTCTFYYHLEGESLKCFEVVRRKKVDRYLGVEMPKQIFNVYVRHHERVRGARNSSLSFVVSNKQRVFKGRVDNISLEGCKVMGNIPSLLKKGEIVSNLTLSLFTKSGSGSERRLHIPEATVAWAKTENAHTEAFGVHFKLTGQVLHDLTEYIDMRLIEDSP